MDQQHQPREPRFRALKSVRVHSGERSAGFECLVRSLSANGARINVADEIPLDERIVLYFVTENLRVPAKVVWRRDGQAGLSFSRALPWLSK